MDGERKTWHIRLQSRELYSAVNRGEFEQTAVAHSWAQRIIFYFISRIVTSSASTEQKALPIFNLYASVSQPFFLAVPFLHKTKKFGSTSGNDLFVNRHKINEFAAPFLFFQGFSTITVRNHCSILYASKNSVKILAQKLSVERW
jgi:hypothetical protein